MIQRERDARRRARVEGAARDAAASSDACVNAASAAVALARGAAGGAPRLERLRAELRELRRKRIEDGDFPRGTLAKLQRDLAAALGAFGGDVADALAAGCADDVALVARLLATGRDDLWDDDDLSDVTESDLGSVAARSTPAASALEKLRSRVGTPSKKRPPVNSKRPDLDALRAMAAAARRPPEPGSPVDAAELLAAKDEFDAPLDEAPNWDDDDDLRSQVLQKDADDDDFADREAASLRERLDAARLSRKDAAAAADAASDAAHALAVIEHQRLVDARKEKRRVLATKEAERRLRDRRAVERLRKEKDRRAAARAAATAAAELERARRTSEAAMRAYAALAESRDARAASVALAVALAEGERHRRVSLDRAARASASAETAAARKASILAAVSLKIIRGKNACQIEDPVINGGPVAGHPKSA